MSDYAARLGDTMRRVRGAANVLPRPSDVCVLVAPPLGRARVWAAFHLPDAWLHAAGWKCDFLANGRRAGVSHREYERWVGTASRAAYQRLVRSGARVTGRVRRRDVEAALADPAVRAIILIAHHVKGDATDGVELLDGVVPAHALTSMLEARNALGPFPFAWLVCCVAGSIHRDRPDRAGCVAVQRTHACGVVGGDRDMRRLDRGAGRRDALRCRPAAGVRPSIPVGLIGEARVIAGVHREVGHVKGDVERTVRALTTAAAVRILRRAFEDAGVLPSSASARASRLADAVAAEPAESFESLRFRGACELALKMLEQEHRRRRRHASLLLGLCAIVLLVTLGLAVSALSGAMPPHMSAAVSRWCLAGRSASGTPTPRVWPSAFARIFGRSRRSSSGGPDIFPPLTCCRVVVEGNYSVTS